MSPRTPALDAFSYSPSSAWSCAGSRSPWSGNQERLFPTTPDPDLSPGPAIVSPDELTLQIDLQLDRMMGSSYTHLLPQPSPPPKADSCHRPGGDMSKVQVFLRNRGRWESMQCDPFESAPPPMPSQDNASDDFSWEATHSALVDPTPLPDSSRCSLLIHEVGLLVGLSANDDPLFSDDGLLVHDASTLAHNVLPLSLTPTKSLAAPKHRNAGLPHPTNKNVPLQPSDIPVFPTIHPHAHNLGRSPHNGGRPLVAPGDLATPIPRHKNVDSTRPSLSPRRRQGRVFQFEPPPSNAPHPNAVDLDETFVHPRPPPPKPTANPPANRHSSLDRLEYSLLKLEAHAPGNHRKSRSEGPPSDHARRDRRPSLPVPRRLRQQQSSPEIMHHTPSRPPHGRHFSASPPPVPRPILPPKYVAPRICPEISLDDNLLKEDPNPGSFMDMDIPNPEEDQQKRRTSFRRVTNKDKMKSLVSVAKRVSRGVIAWGKNFTGSTKPPAPAQEATAVQNTRV